MTPEDLRARLEAERVNLASLAARLDDLLTQAGPELTGAWRYRTESTRDALELADARYLNGAHHFVKPRPQPFAGEEGGAS